MKQGRTINDLAVELKRQLDTKKDYLAMTNLLTMTVDGRHLSGLNKDVPEITGHCHGQIAERLGIPKKYYDKMMSDSPGLLRTNVNHWFENKPEKRMIRLLDGQARAFLSSAYRPIDNWDVANVALPRIESTGCRIESCELTPRRMYLKAVTPKITGEVAKGDVVQAGLIISNSEIGSGSLQVMPMIYRLACLNGMIVGDRGMKKYHVGRFVNELTDAVGLYSNATIEADNKALFMKLADVINGVLDEDGFKEILENLTISAGNKITWGVTETVKEVTRRYSFTESEGKGILNYLAEAGDLTQWGLANAVTKTSQLLDDYDRATEFEKIGGQIVELKPDEWEVIAG